MESNKLFDSYKVTLDMDISAKRTVQIIAKIELMDSVMSAYFNQYAGEIYVSAVPGTHPDKKIKKMNGVEKIELNI